MQTSAIVGEIERLWQVIRARHPDVPRATFTIGSGTLNNPSGIKFGHFGAARWQIGSSELRAEVFLAGELFARSFAALVVEGVDPNDAPAFVGPEKQFPLVPVAVLAVLLHEAAHAVAAARGIKDTSRGGRYHNERFKAIAEELGLTVRKDGAHGWRNTSIAPVGLEAFGFALAQLQGVAVGFRLPERAVRPTKGDDGAIGVAEPVDEDDGDGDGDEGDAPAKRRGRLTLICACRRRIAVAPRVYELGPIVCGVCRAPFVDVDAEPVDDDGEAAIGRDDEGDEDRDEHGARVEDVEARRARARG